MQRLDAVLPGKAFRFGDEDEHHILPFQLNRSCRCPHTDLAPVIDRLLGLFGPRSFDLFLFRHGEEVP